MTTIDRLKSLIIEKYPKLIVTEEPGTYLHIFKRSGSVGIEFLPHFHVLARLLTDENDVELVMQLYSFHGLLLDEVFFPVDCFDDGCVEIAMLENLHSGMLHMCEGVQDVKTEKLERFLRQGKESTLNKVKSLFLIENFDKNTLLRSRLCKYFVRKKEPDFNDYARCEECSQFQHKRSISFYTYLNKYHDREIVQKTLNKMPRVIKSENLTLKEESCDVFHRVHQIVSSKDIEMKSRLEKFQTLDRLGVLEALDRTEDEVNENDNHFEDDFIDHDDIEVVGGNIIDVTSSRFRQIQEERKLMDEKAKEEMKQERFSSEDDEPLLRLRSSRSSAPKPPRVLATKVAKNSSMADKEELVEIISMKQADPDNEEVDRQFWEKLHKQSLEDKLKKAVERKKMKAERAKKRRQKLRSMPKPENVAYEQCTICLHSYPTRSQVTQCMKRHEEEMKLDEPARCPLCLTDIPARRFVTQHFAEVHIGEGKTCCCECLLVIPNENNRLRRHIIKKHHSAGKPVICSQCGRTFTTVPHLKVHLAEHNKEEIIVCHQCGKVFHHRRRLVAHISRLHQPRNLKCIHCDKTFENRQQARRHLSIHTGIKPFKCADCNYCAYKLHNIHTHVTKTHGRKSILEDIVVDEDERERMMQIVKADIEKMVERRNNGV